ncbi:MAG TPA: ATP-binding protein [Actinomycetales bacterium]|nr:ATP-binding protein [Actinomycetales bacterium]
MTSPEEQGASLARRLRQAFTLLVLLVVLVGVAGSLTLSALAVRMENLSTRLTPAIEANADALQRMLDAERGLHSYQATGDRAFLSSYNAARNEVLGQLSRVEELGRQSGLEVDTTQASQAARDWLELYAAPIVAGDETAVPATVRAGRTFEEFRAAQQLTATQLDQERERIRAESKLLRAVSRPALLIVTIACAVLAVVVARGTVRAVIGPLDELRGVLDRLRMGEHLARAPLSGPSEIRSVGVAANALADEGERLRSDQETAGAMRRRTRAASLLVRDQLDRAAVLRAAAVALGTAVEVDQAVVRDLRTGTCAQWQRRDQAPTTGDEAARPGDLSAVHGDVTLVVPEEGERQDTDDNELRLVRHLADANEVLHDPRGRTVAPIEGEHDVLAVATLTTERPREMDGERLRAVQSICGDVGRALELSVVYEQQLELVDRLQQLDRQKTDFLSTVSHELRTPLTSIRGYLELIRDGDAGEVPEPVIDMLDVVDRNAGRLTALIEDLLVLSRIEAGTYGGRTPAEAEADVTAVVRGVVRSLLPQATNGGVKLEANGDLDQRALTVSLPEPELERVVLNLVANAVKFTPPGGQVTVSAGLQTPNTGDDDTHDGDPAAGLVLVTVEDTGIGIPVEDQEQLFDRFFRASNAVRDAVPGTGLGLAIVRGVVQHHGGEVSLRSVPGEGTCVSVRLPGRRGAASPAGT